MTEVWTIYGGDMWRQVFNGVVTVIGSDTYDTLKRIAGLFGVLGVIFSFIKSRNPMVFASWLAIFFVITSVLLVPKRSIQILDVTDPAAVYQVDNVPAGLAFIAGLATSVQFGVARLYEYSFSRPDSLTYTKSGMLFGSQIVAQTTDFRSQNPQLAGMLTDYVENCVVGDILLNNKYTVSQLLNSSDPLTLITNNPSPLRGLYQDTGSGRQFITCQQAAAVVKNLIGADVRIGGTTWHVLATRVFGSRVSGDTLLGNAMDESYNFFYAGGLSAAQIMRNNITNAAIRDGWKGFAARSSDTANLLNLATESSMTKQRISWGAGGVIASRTLPMFQSLMMLVLIALFPLVIALALVNHDIFGLKTLKLYAGGFVYFTMWPVMFAILNSLANFYLQTKTGATPLVLASQDQVALQHSDAANIAGYLSMSIPVLAFFLTKGAASVASQAVGGVMSSAAFATGGQASTTADGNWSFNNMSMDNVSANKFDTNMLRRSGSQGFQTGNNAMMTQTADGHTVVDTSQAISNLPVSMRLSSLASSGFSEQARQAQQQAQSSLDGYNHSVTSGFQQMNQLTQQSGNSDSMTQGSDNSVATNVSKGASKMQSAVENYAKSHNVSEQQAYNQLMDITNQGSAGVRGYVKFDSGDQLAGKVGKWATGLSAGGEGSADWRHTSGSSHGTQDSHAEGRDNRHDQSSQEARDFREGMDMVTSTRLSESGSHTDNQSSSNAQQFAATLNDAKSQYHQYTESSTRSQEFSRMATLSQTQSASLDANYNQEFVDWTTAKYGSDAQNILTNVRSAQGAATEFMHERLEPEIMRNYGTRTDQVNSEPLQPAQSLDAAGTSAGSGNTLPAGAPTSGQALSGSSPVYDRGTSEASSQNAVVRKGQAAEVSSRQGERNLSAPAGAPSQEMREDFRSGSKRVSEQAAGAGIQNNVANQVAAQRSGLMETLRENDGKIAENKTTVQTSSDILRNEHQGAVRSQQIGRTEEDIRQTKPKIDDAETEQFKLKLEKLRAEQKKAS
ncbi:conjugal transfer mating pair stabilization protein TraG [Enterobacteriaceae bacterium EKM102V]|uniref:conjugal transfer mating-pair stabilization protein TraG n=1 Tax=Pantoea TaxID=53335 RepID=UPI00142D6B95|nr:MULTISPECIES: conjugal transfer mating-pair stabilization protein TraG [Pantoea]KAF6653081.1 conjugal transfer mating pair stabilization protein TraG [Enterobacteriaceae bacterium EKM102V]KAF6663494.1 conjugal transfer mating pair stabilization protein TraG [Pantoea sp. EKM103V]